LVHRGFVTRHIQLTVGAATRKALAQANVGRDCDYGNMRSLSTEFIDRNIHNRLHVADKFGVRSEEIL
jgi:hypothetical protein